MATRYPLIIDTADSNKIKEIPTGDDLNLTGNNIVNPVNITASGTLSANSLVIDSSVATIGGQSLHSTAFTGDYNSLSNKPVLFSGSYVDLTNKPTLKTTIESLDNVGSTAPTNGQVLIYNSSLGRYEPGDQTGGGGGGGAGITVQDEGSNLTSSGTILNFVGAGVTATGNGATKTITVTSGTGIALDSLSIGSPASASGSGSIAYNNSTGVFTFTPPDLSSYLTSYTETDTLSTVLARGATTTTSAVIPFYYANQAAFPSATTYHGAIGHSHADGAMYFAHGGSWNKLANFSEIPSVPSIGSITFTGTTIDSSDSSGIVVTPAITMSSDLTVENDLTVNNNINVNGSLNTVGSGTPEIFSDNEIELNAGTRIQATTGPFQMLNVTTTQRDALTSSNGDIIYNTSTNKFQGYENGSWANLI